MPSPETAQLLKRAEQLRVELAEPEDTEREAALVEALETLRRLSGRPSLAAEGAAFEAAVAKALQSIPGILVADHPRSGSVRSQPDLLVRAADRTFLIEVKVTRANSGASLRREVETLSHLVDVLAADRGFLVLPKPVPGVTVDDERVRVVTVSELLDQILEVTKRE
jgi:hypothetical protein